MVDGQYAKTANRSVIGVMNEFSFLATGYRDHRELTDLVPSACCCPKRRVAPSTSVMSARIANLTPRSLRGRTPSRVDQL